MTETFAAIGAFSTFAIAVTLIGAAAFVIISSVTEWLQTKQALTSSTDNLLKTQRALMEANNKLNERVRALEEERESNGKKDLLAKRLLSIIESETRELQAQVERLAAERDNLAKDLADSMEQLSAERERFREASSTVLDAVHQVERTVSNYWNK